jgi:hypothetical protein
MIQNHQQGMKSNSQSLFILASQSLLPYHLQATLVIHWGCVPTNCRLSLYRKRVKWGTCKNSHFDVKLAPEFFDAKRIISIAFPGKPKEGSTQGFKFGRG